MVDRVPLRQYQQDCLNQALQQNTIAFLDTGTGKTNIAIQLISVMGVKTVFLAPTRALVEQQGKRASINDIKTIFIIGEIANQWNQEQWEQVYKQHQLIVMTPQILLNSLRFGFLRLTWFKLIIFDECHKTTGNHPYMKILQQFYHCLNREQRPKVLGLTASPVVGAVKSSQQLMQRMKSLCQCLDSKFAQFDRQSLKSVANKPRYIIQQIRNEPPYDEDYIKKKLVHLPFSELGQKIKQDADKNYKCLIDLLGKKGFQKYLQLLKNTKKIRNQPEILEWLNWFNFEGGISNRIQKTIQILNSHFNQNNSSQAIILCKRRITVWILYQILQEIIQSSSLAFSVGRLVGRPIKSLIVKINQRKEREVVQNFRESVFNVLIATNVVQQGIDIPSCNLVIRFDQIPNDLRSYVQSKGRGRDKNSTFIVFSSKNSKLLDEQKLDEYESGIQLLKDNSDFEFKRLPVNRLPCFEVQQTGAKVHPDQAMQFIKDICQKLSHNKNSYKPIYRIHRVFPNKMRKNGQISIFPGFEAELKLPEALIDFVVYTPDVYQNETQPKKYAALEAARILHSIGKIDNHLRPTWIQQEKKKVVRNYNKDIQPIQDQKKTTEFARYHQPISIRKLKPKEDFYLYQCVTLPKYPTNSSHQFGFMSSVELSQLELQTYPFNLFRYRGINLRQQNSKESQSRISKKYPIKIQFKFLKKFSLTNKQLQKIRVFYGLTFNILMNKCQEFIQSCQKGELDLSEASIFMIPIINNDLDWPMIKRVSKFIKNYNQVSYPIENPETKVIITKNISKPYIIVKTFEDGLDFQFQKWKRGEVELQSVRNYYQQKYNFYPTSTTVYECYSLTSFKSVLRPQISTRSHRSTYPLIPAQMAVQVPIPGQFMLWAKFSPSLFQKINQYYLTKTLRQKELLSDLISIKTLNEALISGSCMQMISYQKLEKFGDAILKFLASDYLFNSNPKDTVGMLSSKRTQKVSNANLYTIAVQHQLYKFIQVTPNNAKKWAPPGIKSAFVVQDSSDQDDPQYQEIPQQSRPEISNKQLADLIESIIAGIFVDNDLECSQEFLRRIGIIQYFTPILYPYQPGQEALGYIFKSSSWLKRALTPPSQASQINYETLEFLGDAVIDFVIVKYLTQKYPEADPGALTLLQSECVNNQFFSTLSCDQGLLDKFLTENPGYQQTVDKFKVQWERVRQNEDGGVHQMPEDEYKVFADIFESVIGAIYMDCRDIQRIEKIIMGVVQKYVDYHITPEKVKKHPHNRILQYAQDQQLGKVQIEQGVEENQSRKDYKTTVKLNGDILVEGFGTSKYKASENAAQKFIRHFERLYEYF